MPKSKWSKWPKNKNDAPWKESEMKELDESIIPEEYDRKVKAGVKFACTDKDCKESGTDKLSKEEYAKLKRTKRVFPCAYHALHGIIDCPTCGNLYQGIRRLEAHNEEDHKVSSSKFQ